MHGWSANVRGSDRYTIVSDKGKKDSLGSVVISDDVRIGENADIFEFI